MVVGVATLVDPEVVHLRVRRWEFFPRQVRHAAGLHAEPERQVLDLEVQIAEIDRSFVGLAATFLGNAAVGMAVDTFVTAENMVQLSAGQLPDLSGFGVLGDALANGIQGTTAGQIDELKAELTSRVDYSTGYTSPMAFEVRISVNTSAAGGDVDNPEDNTLLPVARILMRRSGLGWTVQGVQFAAEVQNLIKTAQNDTSTTSPVTLPERGVRRGLFDYTAWVSGG